ncbi:MAG: long-chain fatty acid--CoA ligase [Gammaproteobacteria bacterium]|nr:long-chain fatty acid--CoA ligase [Gammaproteobacteria bacterium]
MHSLMMDLPLTVTSVMTHAALYHGDREIVTATGTDEFHRTTYNQSFRRARRLANALASLGCAAGERLATLAWNDHRHFEIYYAATCGGYVLHTVNPRLFEPQLEYIFNHAGVRWVFVDPDFIPLLDKLKDRLPLVRGYVVLTSSRAMPASALDNVLCYEELIARESDVFDWPDLDERSACSLCYTSGTTGNPKGALYSHRSIVLHALAVSMPDATGLSANDIVMPVVPMFHVHAWGIPFRAPMVGAKLVFPGRYLGRPEILHALISAEGVNFSVAVPTIWQLLADHLEHNGLKVPSLKRAIVGGAACPQSLFRRFRDNLGVELIQGWGMTELCSVGTVNVPGPAFAGLDEEAKEGFDLKHGRPIFGVQVRIYDDTGKSLPWDGKTTGHLQARGPTVIRRYFGEGDGAAEDAQWFTTGDVASIDPDGNIRITDRSKDLIKSGGEWISSIELENCAMSHPAILEAAVIAAAHEKWNERPVLVAVVKPGLSVTREELIAWFQGRVARMCVPDDVIFVEQLPHTATGKVSKLDLRRRYANHLQSRKS